MSGNRIFGEKMRFGAFIAPFHPIDENPTLAIQRDLELVEWMDRLGYDEAWIGEHHSAAYELIASPAVFIARLRDWKLLMGGGLFGAGVWTLLYVGTAHPADLSVVAFISAVAFSGFQTNA